MIHASRVIDRVIHARVFLKWLTVCGSVLNGSHVLFGSKIVNIRELNIEEQFSERRVKRFGHVTFFLFFTGHQGLFCDKLARATKHPVGLAYS